MNQFFFFLPLFIMVINSACMLKLISSVKTLEYQICLLRSFSFFMHLKKSSSKIKKIIPFTVHVCQ